MLNGIDIFIRDFKKKKFHFGILTNHATLSHTGNPVALELLKNGFLIQKIFSPEHGVYSQAEDGVKQVNGTDFLTGLPVVSLYGERLSPTEKELNDFDILLIDLPNIGCRFYTYFWSISHVLEVCRQQSKQVFILDRPNQRSCDTRTAEGPLLDENRCASYLGRWRMPLSHGFSFGQLVEWFNYHRKLDLNLEVISHEKNSTTFTVPPSPSMPNQQAILLYPFTGIFEGLNVSIGRGTSFPFHVIGAPWINTEKFFIDFRSLKLPGVTAYPYVFKPMWSNYAGVFCNGLYFVVENPSIFQPVITGLQILRYLGQHYEQLQAGKYPTIVNPTGQNHLDLLLGIENSFSKVCKDLSTSLDTISQTSEVSNWLKEVNVFLKL